jgi:hypothetical protein
MRLSAVRFQLDAKSHTVDAGDSRPPSFFAAPEQDGKSPFDLYDADVFNLGRTLLWELENATKVRLWLFSHVFVRSESHHDNLRTRILP